MIISTDEELKALLLRARTIAMIGASDSPTRPSNSVLRYLQSHGYEIRPVNPTHDTVEGLPCYPSLAAAVQKKKGVPDIVDVFRRPDALPTLIEEVIDAGASALWLQLGVVHREAIRRADEAGLTVVVDRCIKVEHARLL